MKVKEVTASTVCRVNIGEHQSRDFFVSMRGELEEGDKPLECARRLSRLADRAVANNVRGLIRARTNKAPKLAELSRRFGFILDEEGK